MNNQQLLDNGLPLLEQIDDHNSTATGSTSIIQRYDTANSKLAAYLVATRQPDKIGERDDVLSLYRNIEAGFNDSELRGLCFDLGVEYDDLTGSNRRDKTRELITHMERRGRLPELTARCVLLRPHLNWGVVGEAGKGPTILSKLNMAVVIDIARPALRNTATYLDDKNIDVNFVVFRHEKAGQFFNVRDDWAEMVISFGEVMARVKREFNGARIHFFMAGPGSLLFAMGCIWGTVDEAIVYHYENNTYHPVITVSRELR